MATRVPPAPPPVTENTGAVHAFSFLSELTRESPVWPRGVAPGCLGCGGAPRPGLGQRAANPAAQGPLPHALAGGGGAPAGQKPPRTRGPRGPHAPLTSLTVTAQRPGSGTAPTAAGAQQSRQSVARSSGDPAGVRRLAAAILTQEPPGFGTSERRQYRCDSAGRKRGSGPGSGAGLGGSWRRRRPWEGGGRGRGHSGGVACLLGAGLGEAGLSAGPGGEAGPTGGRKLRSHWSAS